MPGAMKQVGDADGSRRGRHLDPCKQRMVVHNGVRQEDFINAATAEIERRSVVQAAPRAHAREQPIVLAVPKPVYARRRRIGGLGGLGRFLLLRGSGAAGRLRCGRRVWIPAFGRLLLRLDSGHAPTSRKNAPAIANRIPFRIRRRSILSFRAIGSTDCGQARKGCKGGKKISPGISSRAGGASSRRVGRLATTTTRDCIFSLDTTRAAAQNPRNFFRGFLVSGGPDDPSTRKKWRVIPEGEKRAVFAGMDCAMHQSGVRGSRPLAASIRLRRRTLQQLQRSAPQCSAAARPTPADASPFAG